MRLGAYMPNEIWAIGNKLRKAGEVLTHLITFGSIFIPSRGRQSPKSSEWIARAIDRISQNFPGIGEKWNAKLSVEIRKSLNAIWDLNSPYYDGPTTLIAPKDRVWYRGGRASEVQHWR